MKELEKRLLELDKISLQRDLTENELTELRIIHTKLLRQLRDTNAQVRASLKS